MNKQALFFPTAQQPHVGHSLLTLEASLSHSHTPHSVGLLWTSDQLDAETSTWQHTTFRRNGHPCPGRDSNPQSQKASLRPRGHRDGHTRTLSKFFRPKLTKNFDINIYLTAEGPKFRTFIVEVHTSKTPLTVPLIFSSSSLGYGCLLVLEIPPRRTA